MSNKIDTDNFWNAFHESVGPSTSEALDNDTKKLGIPAVRFITEDWKNLIEEIRQEERHEYAKEVRAFMNDALEVAKESEIQRAKQEARREALKEMDEAHIHGEDKYTHDANGDIIRNKFRYRITDLRKEYSNQP